VTLFLIERSVKVKTGFNKKQIFFPFFSNYADIAKENPIVGEDQ